MPGGLVAGACGCTWSWSGLGVVAGRLRHRAVVGDPPVVHDHGPADQRLAAGPSSCATSSTVPPPADEAAQRAGERLLAGRVDAGGRLVEDQQLRLGRPARGRSACAAAGRRRGWRPGRRPGRRGRPRASAAATAARSAAPGRAAARRGGPAGRRRPPRRRSPARRCRRRAAAARSRSARHCRNRRSGVPNSVDRAGGSAAPGRARPGSGWTCRSRWRRGSRPPRRRSTVSETSAQHGAAVVGDHPVRDARRRRLMSSPAPCRSAARLARMTER